MAVSLKHIQDFFDDEANQLVSRGENLLQSDRVQTLLLDRAFNHLEGIVQASKKKASYKVRVALESDGGGVAHATCECVRGQGKCAHMAALLLLAREKFSPTDVACRWSKRKVPNDGSVHQVSSVFKERNIDVNYGPVDESVFTKLSKDLADCPRNAGYGVVWLLKPNPEPSHEVEPPTYKPPDAVAVIKSDQADIADNLVDFVLERLILSWSEILSVAEETKGQASNPEWARVRKGRLTASKFGLILKAMKKRGGAAPSRSLLESIVVNKNLDRVKSIQWGKSHEEAAIKEYTTLTHQTVENTGIWLHESGMFGASPDGLIGEDSVLEVKCPYSFRNEKLEDALSKNPTKKYIVQYNEEGVWKIDCDHEYYHQMQGSLYFTKRAQVILYIWTTKGSQIFTVKKDPAWEANISVLEKFYCDYFIPFVRTSV